MYKTSIYPPLNAELRSQPARLRAQVLRFSLNSISAAALALASLNAQALTIGNPSSSIALNAPLDVRFDVVLGPGEAIESDCVRVSAFNGEQLISPALLGVTVERTPAGATIRVRSASRISEPLVNLSVAVTCQGSFVRNFSIFANPASNESFAQSAGEYTGRRAQPIDAQDRAAIERTLAPVPAPGALLGSPRPRVVEAAEGQAPSRRARRRAEAAEGEVARASTAAPAAGTKARASGSKAILPSMRVAQDAVSVQPALKLDVGGSIRAFRISSELQSQAAAPTEARRAELRSLRDLLIAELNSSSGPSGGTVSAATASRILELEKQNQGLQSQVKQVKSQLSIETAARVEAESQKMPGWLIPALLVALALVGGGVAWLLSRRSRPSTAENVFAPRSASEVLSGGAAESAAFDADVKRDIQRDYGQDDLAPALDAAPTPWWKKVLPGRKKADRGFATLPMPADGGSTAAALEQEAKDSIKINFNEADDWGAQSLLTPVEQLAVNEVADLSQEAEFFIEIGQYEQAIRLLEQNIDQEHEITPVPQLYLFDLYRRTDRKDEYVSLLTTFAQRFNVYIPAWDDQVTGRRELMEYPRAMEQICRAWRGTDALTIMEGLLVDDTRGQRMGFDLPAYRDIVFLYGIAKQLMADGSLASDDVLAGVSRDSASPAALVEIGANQSDEVDFELPLGDDDDFISDEASALDHEFDTLRPRTAQQTSSSREWPTTIEVAESAAKAAAAAQAAGAAGAKGLEVSIDQEFDLPSSTPAALLSTVRAKEYKPLAFDTEKTVMLERGQVVSGNEIEFDVDPSFLKERQKKDEPKP